MKVDKSIRGATTLGFALVAATLLAANEPEHHEEPAHAAPAKPAVAHAPAAHAPGGTHGAPAEVEDPHGASHDSHDAHGSSPKVAPTHGEDHPVGHGEAATKPGDHGSESEGHGDEEGGTPAHDSPPAAGHGAAGGHGAVADHGTGSGHAKAGKGHAVDPAVERERALRKKRQEEADSGRLSGVLPRNAVIWKPRKKSKPLYLESDVVVGPGQVLEIGEGTVVHIASRDRAPLGAGDWADSQFVSLIVRGGTLRILGTRERPVRFIPGRPGKGARWGGILVEDTRSRSQFDLSWVDLPAALQGIVFDRAAGSVRHAVISDGNIGILAKGGSAPEILHSVVARQKVAGLHSERSGVLVRASLFLDNAGPGARFDGVGLARLENNAFWNNAAGDLLRAPPGTGGWKTDSVVAPDAYGNVRAHPVLRSSALHRALLAKREDSLRTAPIWRRRLPEPPPGAGPWALSPFSPLLDRGSRLPLCRDSDGSACDIGLWGGRD